MSDLLPCPFCGGKADIDYDGSVYDGTHVYCTECDIRTESYKTKTGSTWDVDAAIAAWNRRALPAAQPDPREAALRDIARQKKTDEMDTEYDVEYADFEGGYNAIIDVARRALPALQPVTVDQLAQIIRTVDGNHSLGAGALAERILSALEPAVQPDAGWQPIETAPKDRVIDLWSVEGGRYPDAVWGVCGDTEGWTDANDHGSLEGGAFTHWRDRPAPPATPMGDA